MKKYRFEEHGVGYQLGKALRPWRPQFPVIFSWIPKGAKVLDVGCGDGVLGERLRKEKNCTVYGLDLDEVGVEEAKRRGVKAKVWDADEGLPFKTNQFDIAICNELLELVRKPDLVVSEVARVGKTAIVEFPNFAFWFYRLELLWGRFPHFALYGHKWWETQMIKFFSYSDFLRLPSMQHLTIKRRACIDWKNRKISFLAKFFPNLFGRSCILELVKATKS